MKHKPKQFSAFLCALCQKPVMLSHFIVTLSHTDRRADALEYTACESCYGKVCYVLIELGVQNIEEHIARMKK